MYIPKLFQIDDENLVDGFLRKYSFVTLVATQNNRMEAVSVPVLISPDRTQISFHIAAANPIREFLKSENQVLFIFNGPHAYISPRWYTQPSVPTWNYTSVHAYAQIEKILEPAEMFSDLEKLVATYESEHFVKNMFTGAGQAMVPKLMPGIIGYVAKVIHLQAKFKLSQNRDPISLKTIISELKTSTHPSDIELGHFMESFYQRYPVTS
jgi:transcriptional regulator